MIEMKQKRTWNCFCFFTYIVVVPFQLNKQRNAYEYTNITSCLMTH